MGVTPCNLTCTAVKDMHAVGYSAALKRLLVYTRKALTLKFRTGSQYQEKLGTSKSGVRPNSDEDAGN